MWQPISRPRGFSLIEVLVVLAIISVALTGISISFFQSDVRKIDEQVSQLSEIFQTVSDRASLLNRLHRIQLSAGGIQVDEFFRGQWRGNLSDPLQTRPWRDGVSFVDPPITLVVESTGLFSTSVFRLQYGQQQNRVSTNAFGEVSVAATP